MRRVALLLATGALAGCAYFNGIYNARQAERKGDSLARAGRSADADSLYTLAATTAESVLARHARSRWADDALLIAGWSWAMAARCDLAEPRLTSILTRHAEPEARLERATLALGICRVREGREAEGRTLLAPLTLLPDRRVAREASLWAALASVALGDADSANAYLQGADRARAEWELASAFLARREFAAAESLLARRAQRGEYRPDLLQELRALWLAGRTEGVRRLVSLYDRAHTPASARARLHLLVGKLALASGHDSVARIHLATAQRLARDTIIAREASAHLTLAELGSLTSLVDVENVIVRAHERAAGDPLQRRLEDNLLLAKMLHDRDDATGAALFLAAEVARDSLRAPILARTIFESVAAIPRTPFTVKALLAAERIAPEPGAGYQPRADTLVHGAAFGDVGPDGRTDDAPGGVEPADRLLLRTWDEVRARHADSVRHLRPSATVSPANVEPAHRAAHPPGATQTNPR